MIDTSKAKLFMQPTRYAAGKLYNVIPRNSYFTVTRNSGKNAIKDDGYIWRVAANVPSIIYDYGKGIPKLLSERASTNLISYPFDLGNSYLVKSGVTIDDNSGNYYPSPFKDTSGNVLLKARKATFTGTSDYIQSPSFTKSGAGTVGATLIIDTDAECLSFVGGTSNNDYKVKELADGYYLHTLSAQVADAASYSYKITGLVAGTYDISGTQFEVGNPTSFINDAEAVEGTQVTRVADDLSIPGLQVAGVIGATEGTIIFDFSKFNFTVFGTSSPTISLFAGSSITTDAIAIIVGSTAETGYIAYFDGTSRINMVSNVNINDKKIGITWKTNSILVYIDGVELYNSTTFNPKQYDVLNFNQPGREANIETNLIKMSNQYIGTDLANETKQ